jgi:hypothetical protein
VVVVAVPSTVVVVELEASVQMLLGKLLVVAVLLNRDSLLFLELITQSLLELAVMVGTIMRHMGVHLEATQYLAQSHL